MDKPTAEAPTLYIDSNEESKHHYSMHAKMVAFNPEIMPLEVGDFRFFAMNVMWTVERKAAPSDLEASFQDMRLNTQHWKAVDSGIQRLIILLEGDPNLVERQASVKNTLIELQAHGTFIDFCAKGEVNVLLRLMELYKWLSADDHSYLRKPPLPVPSQFRYTDRNFRDVVRGLMCIRGISEGSAVAIARRFTLGQIADYPPLVREAVPSLPRQTVKNIYQYFGREIPAEVEEGLAAGTRTKKKSVEVPEEEVIDLTSSTLLRTIGATA